MLPSLQSQTLDVRQQLLHHVSFCPSQADRAMGSSLSRTANLQIHKPLCCRLCNRLASLHSKEVFVQKEERPIVWYALLLRSPALCPCYSVLVLVLKPNISRGCPH
jgi:hypothetical protein